MPIFASNVRVGFDRQTRECLSRHNIPSQRRLRSRCVRPSVNIQRGKEWMLVSNGRFCSMEEQKSVDSRMTAEAGWTIHSKHQLKTHQKKMCVKECGEVGGSESELILPISQSVCVLPSVQQRAAEPGRQPVAIATGRHMAPPSSWTPLKGGIVSPFPPPFVGANTILRSSEKAQHWKSNSNQRLLSRRGRERERERERHRRRRARTHIGTGWLPAICRWIVLWSLLLAVGIRDLRFPTLPLTVCEGETYTRTDPTPPASNARSQRFPTPTSNFQQP
jgi:hypothetical protein